MRAYYFGNMYLSSIQQGIQALHATHEIYERYRGDHDKGLQIKEWATYHKTVVLLNAGYGEEIHDLVRFFHSVENEFPWAPFSEEEASLSGAITCVGILLPQRIYDISKILRKREVVTDSTMKSVRDQIEDNGEVTMYKENAYGIVVDEFPVTWRFNKWEYQLMDRLNQYGLAR